ncbi:hypothetical protein BDZ45DRAFT_390959 [Acephala macrosclerotiorum]|nr:hypothetical protein BDZ45DRAFT_390959 [Acephala macrosclerotiorum]
MDPQDEPLQLEFEALESRRKTLGQIVSSISLAGPPLSEDPGPEAEEEEEEEGVLELIISKSHMTVRLRSIQRGTYNDFQSALLIFDVIFQPYTPQRYRFKSARFEITFQKQTEFVPYSSQPRVLSYAPMRATGEITPEKKAWETKTGITASIPLAPVTPELNLSVSKSSSYTAEHKMIVQGATKPPSKPFIVWWTLSEKKLVKEGLPHDCAFAVIVSCDGPFFATFKTEAEVGAGSFSRKMISRRETKYKRLIDPQREFGPQFGGKGVLDLKNLDLGSRYQNGSGISFDTKNTKVNPEFMGISDDIS